MKTRDEIERQLCQIILDAAQFEQDDTGEFMVPADILSDLRPAERATVDVARRACGISDKTWDREFRIHNFVAGIMEGRPKNGGVGFQEPPGKHHPGPAEPGPPRGHDLGHAARVLHVGEVRRVLDLQRSYEAIVVGVKRPRR